MTITADADAELASALAKSRASTLEQAVNELRKKRAMREVAAVWMPRQWTPALEKSDADLLEFIRADMARWCQTPDGRTSLQDNAKAK